MPFFAQQKSSVIVLIKIAQKWTLDLRPAHQNHLLLKGRRNTAGSPGPDAGRWCHGPYPERWEWRPYCLEQTVLTPQLTGKDKRTNVRAAKLSSWQYLLVAHELRASVQTGLPGSSKVYGIEDRHLADEKAVKKILDANLQKESSKFNLLWHLKPERAVNRACVLSHSLWFLEQIFQGSREKRKQVWSGIYWYYWCKVLLPEQEVARKGGGNFFCLKAYWQREKATLWENKNTQLLSPFLSLILPRFCFLSELLNYTDVNLYLHPLVSPLLACLVHPWPEVCGYKDGAISSHFQVHLLFHWLGFMALWYRSSYKKQ